MSWALYKHDDLLLEGSEQEVREVAQRMVNGASDVHTEAHLREALYLTRPDGSHLGQHAHDGYFTPGEPIDWIEVDW